MDLTSPQFDEGASIPRAHTCDGEDIPPDLRWSGVPGGIVELALTCEDPDAPSGTFERRSTIDARVRVRWAGRPRRV
jgi:phosphatidylethanolamine-binding protein (PEBP) family uncharacterized protein